ncbi:MAG TPA: DUF3310 domain-containing protein [Polyangiaceae bacterium]|nr:DUF3310 domain-containing protein [Polyangiaceae bacterium]
MSEKSRVEMMEDFFEPDSADASWVVKREEPDPVHHPTHYTNGPACPHCGNTIECITITEQMGFCDGNAVKYIWRRKMKGKPLEDLKKARWYIDREIARLEAHG